MTPEIEAARTQLIERLTLTDPSYDASFDRIVRLLKSLTGTSAAAFTVLEGGRQFYKAHEGIDQRETPRDVSFCTHTIEQGDMLVVDDARADPRFSDSALVCGPGGHCFYAGLPVRAPSGLPVGALCILDEQPRQLTSEQRTSLEDLRGMLEESLMLRALAVVDALTGLFNRRHFEETVTREWLRGFAVQLPLAVCMLDIDHFKRYNDSYGHASGDACLRRVAGALQTGARRFGDVLARIGGEEFALVLPNTDARTAGEIGDTIHRAIAELDIPHQHNPGGRVTASIGIAIVDRAGTEGETFEQALARADAALYRAKETGRNREKPYCPGMMRPRWRGSLYN